MKISGDILPKMRQTFLGITEEIDFDILIELLPSRDFEFVLNNILDQDEWSESKALFWKYLKGVLEWPLRPLRLECRIDSHFPRIVRHVTCQQNLILYFLVLCISALVSAWALEGAIWANSLVLILFSFPVGMSW